MKNILRIVAILIAVAVWYFIYQDNQKIQDAMDTMENSIINNTWSTGNEITTGIIELDNNDVIISGDVVSTGELQGTPAPDFMDGATDSSIDVVASGSSAE